MDIKLPFLKSPIGSGDLVKAATSAVGIQPCGGCKQRAAAMNQAVTFVPRKDRGDEWTKPPEMPAGWKLDRMYTGAAKQVALFVHESGGCMVWEILDGAYRNSHHFCAGCVDDPKSLAIARWGEMCRSS
jgi:hypothetical protein